MPRRRREEDDDEDKDEERMGLREGLDDVRTKTGDIASDVKGLFDDFRSGVVSRRPVRDRIRKFLRRDLR